MGAATSQISYSASKGGVLSMSRELGVQFAREGVRVNALCPGPVNTPLLKELFASDAERAARRLVHVPMGRFGEPEEMANAVLFLASDESSFITANTFLVDGGISGAYVTPALRPECVPAPVIGLTTYREDARVGGVGPARRPAAGGVRRRGRGRAAAYPCCCRRSPTPGAAARWWRGSTGSSSRGGADVDPDRYGEEPHARTAGWRPDRDAWELALLDAAEAAGLPMLGVCRGMQLMAVARRRALDQHTPDLVGHEQHSPGGGRLRLRSTWRPSRVAAGRARRRPRRGQLPPPPVGGHAPRLRRGRPGRPTGPWRRWRRPATAGASPSSGTRRPAWRSG